MNNEDELTLEVLFDSKTYGQVACKINIIDGVALAKFSDVRLARDMYNLEKKAGNKNVYFKERLSAFGELYPNKTKEVIARELVTKFEEHNGKVKQKK